MSAKFVELLDYVGVINGESECSCCGCKKPNNRGYKKGERLVVLCERCQEFLEELLD